ncbi:MAG: hypothetical protein JKY71_05060 [Alphaproteobacteria bacterium]|nr:hypothetical protein [Alphaproteobacteria bacterium]
MQEQPENEYDWHELGTYETKKFMEDVTDEGFKELFEGPAYELWSRNLRFFDGYEHYLLCNKTMIPNFTLEYISNGENHYFLDGSEHPLELLINKGSFRLTIRNVMDYVQFHSDVTFYPYRKVKFIADPSKSPYSGASSMGHHFKTLKYHAKQEVHESEEDECFYITMPVIYNGDTVEGHVQVKKTGEISILEPINIPLMDGKTDHNPLDYDHPHEDELLAQNSAVLCQSAEGKRLWDTVKSYGGEIKVVSGVGSNAFAPSAAKGFIVAPEHLEFQSPYQVIGLAGVLRQMEHHLMDEKRPDPFEDINEVLERNVALNLDILLKICIIVDELNEAGDEEILRRFKKAGFEEFYGGYKNNISEEKLAGLMAKFMHVKVAEE